MTEKKQAPSRYQVGFYLTQQFLTRGHYSAQHTHKLASRVSSERDSTPIHINLSHLESAPETA